MWGDFELLQFYPRHWQVSYARSNHDLLNYISVWQYWLWFTFIFLINVYFVLIFRVFSIRRADVRGRRAVGDKRRGAWPELFTCFFPFLWVINILNNSLFILQTIESNGSYPLFTMQISAYQWGWHYHYGEMTYFKILTTPIKVGFNTIFKIPHTEDADINMPLIEAQFIRQWATNVGRLDMTDDFDMTVPLYKTLNTLSSQATNIDSYVIKVNQDYSAKIIANPLRLLNVNNAPVLPTRSTIRLLTTAEDVIHSWAVPGLAIKLDCVPGRLYVSFINISREGVYYGQCSELCGWTHFNMPIVLYAIPLEHFLLWWEIEFNALLKNKLSTLDQHYKLINVKYK